MNKKKTHYLNRHLFRLSLLVRAERPFILLYAVALLVLAVATYFSFLELNSFRQLNLAEYEVGKVAERDIVAVREFSYVDEEATQIRRDARQRLVTAVFRYDRDRSANLVREYTVFCDFLEEALRNASSPDQFILEVQQAYPGMLDRQQIAAFFASRDRLGLVGTALAVYKQIINEGYTALPDQGMERFNQSDVEIIRIRNDRSERSLNAMETLLTARSLRTYVQNSLVSLGRPVSQVDQVLALIRPFLRENLLFQSEESENKLEAASKQVQPVLVVIPKDHKIIRRGFIISEENYRQLEALAGSGMFIDTRLFLGTVLFFCVILLCALFLFSPSLGAGSHNFAAVVFLTSLFIVHYLSALITSHIDLFSLPLDHAFAVPTALIVMLTAALKGQRTAFNLVLLLTLGMAAASGFQFPAALFCLLSGAASVRLMNMTSRRIDLVRSAVILAIIQPLLAFLIANLMPGSIQDTSFTLMASSVNGFLSGILVLGFLPVFEAALNTSTSFRLMEFSDLNSPIMKRMLLGVSGTYNHSIMVATLAESACREIGANSLLARVGAYYHDIGKMDQPEYYVENQTDHNRHLDLNPRLSATVIRSHVKQGVEKARQLRLPEEVIDIIAEHHGDSLIQYFYSEAKKLDPDVDPEDFTYPGNPPRSRESAVVMLADVVEAACRTLDKPSVPRLEKFINELVSKKRDSGQLDNSDLTFRELEIIKQTFVNILAGYYHSRIEYPGQKESGQKDLFPVQTPAKRKNHE